MKKILGNKQQLGVALLLLCIVFMACSGGTKDQSPTTDSAKTVRPLEGFSKKELYDELVARNKNKSNRDKEATTTDTVPTNEKLKVFKDKELYDVIYDVDDRKNLYEITDAALLADAEKSACILKKNLLRKNADGSFTIVPDGSYQAVFRLCDEERFKDEPVASFCSGFAIDKDLFVTAGHCIKNEKVDDLVIVYGYAVNTAGSVNLTIQASDVYQPVKVVARELNEATQNDFCLLKIKGRFQPERIAKIRREGKIADNEDVHVIGYPCGLPMKVTPNGKVFNNSISNYFVTNLDTYGGNSGSPVFNSKTHVVEGILVRGNKDFQTVTLNNCRRSFPCPHDIGSCRGEDVSRISQFWKWLK